MEIKKYVETEITKLSRVLGPRFFRNPFSNWYLVKLLWTQNKAQKKRSKSLAKGMHIPPMLLISVTEKCNLRCKGCYSQAFMTENHDHCQTVKYNSELTMIEYKKIFDEAKEIGISLITLVGGEPLLRRDLIKLAATYPEIIFSIYTNGMLLDETYLKLFLKNRHLVPFFSIEGYEQETDSRRGFGVYKAVIDKMIWLRNHQILFGVSITITKDNLEVVTSSRFVQMLYDYGCFYISYVEFEAMTEEDLVYALSKEERIKHLQTLAQIEEKFKRIFFTSYPDSEYRSGGCLGAGRGFFHLNAYGDAQPCNFVPDSDSNIRTKTILEILASPLFKTIIESGMLEKPTDGECALLHNKEKWSH